MKIVIASGKGGVGKTVISAALASHLSKKFDLVAIDADVDCPNLQLLFSGELEKREPISCSKLAVVDREKCVECGACKDVCRFGALDYSNGPHIDELLCEGCGACCVACPHGAIKLVEEESGEMLVKETRDFQLVYGKLKPGRSGSGKVVFELKKLAGEKELTLIDAPAGIDCPAIAAITDSDLVIVVIEPTPSGIADATKMIELTEHFNIPHSVVLNKAGISAENEERVREIAGNRLIGEIPYDEGVPRAIARLHVPSEGKAGEALKELCKMVERRCETG